MKNDDSHILHVRTVSLSSSQQFRFWYLLLSFITLACCCIQIDVTLSEPSQTSLSQILWNPLFQPYSASVSVDMCVPENDNESPPAAGPWPLTSLRRRINIETGSIENTTEKRIYFHTKWMWIMNLLSISNLCWQLCLYVQCVFTDMEW